MARSCPFNQSLLCPDDCFVLDTGAGGKVYVWKGARGRGWGRGQGTGDRATPHPALTSPSAGRKANEQERQAALSVAEQTITRMGYSPHTQVGGGGLGDVAHVLPSPSCPHRHPTGGNPASGPRDAPLQAVLQRLEVRGHRGDRAAQGQAVTPIPTATVFPTAPPSLCQLQAQPSAVPSHHPYHIQGRAIPMPAPSPHHPTANAISSPVSVASHPSANPVPIPCRP